MTRSFVTATICSGLLAACAPESAPAVPTGDPLPGLSEPLLARFRAGEVLFNQVFSPEQGLGPLFNENQCSACHTTPVTGGTGDQLVARGTVFTSPDRCDAMTAEAGDNIRTNATPLLRAHGITRQEFPARAVETGNFTPSFLFGLGLIEAIPERAILSRADPDDRDADGISGRPGRAADGRLGRFGRKADAASLEDFTHIALRMEMGLTTTRHASEAFGGLSLPDTVDPAPDPEVTDDAVALLTDFVRFLAPPDRGEPRDSLDRRLVHAGARTFAQTGCAACHVPAMTTGRSRIAALDRRTVQLYSDLLLHDLGDGMKSTCAGSASPTEYRTAPLMGLRLRGRLLHDGRALNVLDAIAAHGGEAAAARAHFQALSETQRIALLKFLATL